VEGWKCNFVEGGGF